MNSIFSKIWGSEAGAAVLILAAAGLYLRGKSTGPSDERQERETAINKQQTEARETVREIKDEVGKLGDSALREHASKWVRNK
ncbi:MAG TPA: hypothetical protein DD666_13860 [Advenella kashmirensis]|uniref:Uncharacterized protein n=1 Tax=Advenella kashmirensis TaxID=310575 RepID=A0A356LIC3_9BURK|nr:hypothetical protein [Advenella kashmirensis]